ncbi:MAG: hypothetical protein AVDCRST_MAG87-2509 [uncultured Thermomicrobiales bacterium]|uniref:DUF8173 domain-containing protein n=1 Tax=uncultured Thermomicrobiales bacterium TaxID=1645740 RepID=A0A6J4VC20_9BACT|nr:MAG: hypothetical protein AVDCRST_MAG87-2509 [uncultured Thermomicrobiales bacterium]
MSVPTPRMSRPSHGVIPAPPRASRMTLASFAIILLFATLALPIAGTAGEVRSGGSVTIAPSVTIADDLYIAAGTVELQGPVGGDASIVAGTATVGGTIEGSVNILAGRARIPGDVGGSLRVAGGGVEISGAIGGDLVVAGGRVTVLGRSSIGGDVIVTGGSVEIVGRIAGDVRGSAIDMSIGGDVRGRVDVETSRFAVTPTARIAGTVDYASATSGAISTGATIGGAVTRAETTPWSGGGWLEQSSGRLLRTLWALIAGAGIVAVAPRVADAIARNGRGVLPAFGVGLLALVAAPVAAIALAITQVGLPSGVILVTLFLIALYLAQVFAGLTIGRFILPRSWDDGSRGYNLLAMTLGVILIGLTSFIPIPFVSAAIAAVVTLWGLGAAAMLLGQLGPRSPSGSLVS